MVSSHEPSYDEIKNLALKPLCDYKKKIEPQPSDEELKLGGYWTKARLILQGKKAIPQHVRKEMVLGRRVTCPNCRRNLPFPNLVMECENCHKIGCLNCIGIRTFVDAGREWKPYITLRRKVKLKTLRGLPKKKLCKDCLYLLDEL